MKIGFITQYDPKLKNHWSGLGFSMLNAMQNAGFDVEALGPLIIKWPLLGRAKSFFYRKLFSRSFGYERERLVCASFAAQIKKKLEGRNFDWLFVPGATNVISYLDCRIPIAVWADSTVPELISHYGLESRIAPATLRSWKKTEELAYSKISLFFFASEWAKQSAIRDYGIDRKNAFVVPFGANIQSIPCKATVHKYIERRSKKMLELLTIGVDWDRKGVSRSIALAKALRKRGISARLTVVGCLPPASESVPDFVDCVGFIHKDDPDGERRMAALYSRSHFHVLLSRAEAFGVVYAEANAYGVPNIAADIGGVAASVVDGLGGRRFPSTSDVETIADYIEDHFIDFSKYTALAFRAREQFNERLNWSVAGRTVAGVLRDFRKH